MKKILVPTDFSPVADNALQYAIEIAAAFKSELFLYHVYSFDRFNYDLNYHEYEQPFAKEMERKMKLTKQRLEEKIKQTGLSVTTFVERGNIPALFQSKVQELGIDLIVMGTKGATGLEKVVFGSVAAAALEMAKVPVLVIPPGRSFRPIEHIVLAIDHKETDANVLSPLQKLAFNFGTGVTLLNVKTGSNQGVREIGSPTLKDVAITYREVPLTKNINESINDYIKKEGCDLLCMIKREKGFFESIFQKSIATEQVYNSQVPLLVLPEKR